MYSYLRALDCGHAPACTKRILWRCAPHHPARQPARRCVLQRRRSSRLPGMDAEYCAKQGVEILAYCLMTNPVHVVAVPPEQTAFEQVFRPLHTKYAQRINRAKRWKGICGKGGFSPPLSMIPTYTYLWAPSARTVEECGKRSLGKVCVPFIKEYHDG